MNSYTKVGLFALALIAICSAVSLLTVRTFSHSNLAEPQGGHEWLHDQLDPSEVEREQLRIIEEKYKADRIRLESQLEELKARLAQILIGNKEYTDEVTEAVHQIHESHGAIQQLSIRHYFDMIQVLSAENQEKLKILAVDALSQPE